jgi:hypothetical protein
LKKGRQKVKRYVLFYPNQKTGLDYQGSYESPEEAKKRYVELREYFGSDYTYAMIGYIEDSGDITDVEDLCIEITAKEQLEINAREKEYEADIENKVLNFIKSNKNATAGTFTVYMIMQGCGISTASEAKKHIEALIKKGLIEVEEA